MYNELARAGIDFDFYTEYKMESDTYYRIYSESGLDQKIKDEIDELLKRVPDVQKRAGNDPGYLAARQEEDKAYEKYSQYRNSKLNPFAISMAPIAEAKWFDAGEKAREAYNRAIDTVAGDKWLAQLAKTSEKERGSIISELNTELRNKYRFHDPSSPYKQKITEELADEDEKKTAAMVAKLMSSGNALDKMVNSLAASVKEKDKSMDKGAHVSLISYDYWYTVYEDKIFTPEIRIAGSFREVQDRGFPTRVYIFEENGYKNLADKYQAKAVALVLGQAVKAVLLREPVFEMASITATGEGSSIKLHIAYPNTEHAEMVSLF